MICRRDLVREIIQCEAYLQKITVELEKLKKEVPQGARLRATRHGNSYQYFIRENGTERNGTYIKKKEYNKAIILAQIEYDEKVIRILEERITDLRKWNDKWIDDPFNHVKEQMSPGKGNIIRMPYISNDREGYLLVIFVKNALFPGGVL